MVALYEQARSNARVLRGGIYLRKSRLDIENEKKTGVKDTLEKHRRDLIRLAKKLNIDIIDEYEEVESGDSIIHRPEMLRLLRDVADGKLDCVVVIDLDRLGRGDLQDQGLILNTFKKSKTLIVTLDKIYDLSNEVDEDYAEFKSFMSRKEYKMITKRMRAGVRRYVEDGNYIPSKPPYGYQIVQNGRKRTLVIDPERAEAIKLAFELFLKGFGIRDIARELTAMGYKSYYGHRIEHTFVSRALRNPVYAGYIAWGREEVRKSSNPDKKYECRKRDPGEYMVVKGSHEPIISEEVFQQVQEKLKEQPYATPIKKSNEIVNPLAGLIKCKVCGYTMRRACNYPYGKPIEYLQCMNFCTNRGTKLKDVEDGLIEALREWLDQYKCDWYAYKEKKTTDQTEIYTRKIAAAKKELNTLKKQMDNLYNLVEKGAYDIDTYLMRSRVLSQEISETEANLQQLEKDFEDYTRKLASNQKIIPKVEKLLESYHNLSVEEKNRALKSILNYAVYYKSKEWRGNRFELELAVKI